MKGIWRLQLDTVHFIIHLLQSVSEKCTGWNFKNTPTSWGMMKVTIKLCKRLSKRSQCRLILSYRYLAEQLCHSLGLTKNSSPTGCNFSLFHSFWLCPCEIVKVLPQVATCLFSESDKDFCNSDNSINHHHYINNNNNNNNNHIFLISLVGSLQKVFVTVPWQVVLNITFVSEPAYKHTLYPLLM